MNLKLVTAPVIEPVPLADAKTHIRVDSTTEDIYIGGLIAAARSYVEHVTRRALLTQTLELVLDAWPTGTEIALPRPPLQSVTSITYVTDAGATNTFSSDNYTVDADSEPGRIVLKTASNWPSDELREVAAIRVRYVAGWTTPSAVPQNIVHAMRLLIGHLYENREATITGTIIANIPMGVDALLWPSRMMGF